MGISLEERMKSPFFGRDWIDVSSLTKDEVEYLLDKAEQFDKWILEGDIGKYALADGLGMIMASIFYENSTRTRCSFEIGAKRLGIEVTGFSGKEGTSVEKGESLTDTVDMFHSYNMDGLIMRHDRDGAAKAVVEHLKREGGKRMPVFNGGDGKNEHPTQAVLDAAAIRQCCGRLDHLQIGIGVDALYGRTVHSLPVLLSMWPGNVFHIFTHPLLRMPNAVLRFLDAKGIEYHEYFESRDQLREMLPQLDLGYWTRPQKERFRDISEYYQAREMFVITPDLLPLLRPGFGLFHPLPDNKEFPSIHPAIHQTPFYWAKKQAGKGPTTRMPPGIRCRARH
ncbi:hypothetical protein KY363_04990 [Candidatus Woesearchaeota archaeon]|nr:hypothetical protein [Candidatus Woesearchaeota archaeon]